MSQVPVVCTASTVFLIDKDSEEAQVLLFRRLDPPVHTWSQISGGIEAGETAWQAALREVQEETGITLDEICLPMLTSGFTCPRKTASLSCLCSSPTSRATHQLNSTMNTTPINGSPLPMQSTGEFPRSTPYA